MHLAISLKLPNLGIIQSSLNKNCAVFLEDKGTAISSFRKIAKKGTIILLENDKVGKCIKVRDGFARREKFTHGKGDEKDCCNLLFCRLTREYLAPVLYLR